MVKRPHSLVPLLSAALLAGCGGGEREYVGDEGAIPAGAIPAAYDVRPGTRAAPGNVQQPGTSPDQAGQPAGQATGATNPAAIDAAATAPADTAR